MTDLATFLSALPPAALAGLGILLLVQLTLQIVALVDLAHRPDVPVGKWLWLVIILFGQLLGAAVYLALRRGWVVSAPDDVRAGGKADRDEALDLLYGRDE